MGKILFHGTSKSRLDKILAEDRLAASTVGDPAVCASHEIGPAEYWANMSAWADSCDPVVIRLDHEALLNYGYEMVDYDDQIYGEGKCTWEQEIRVYGDISSLSAVMLGYAEIPWSDIRCRCPCPIPLWASKSPRCEQQARANS